jgi:hypothetical protein
MLHNTVGGERPVYKPKRRWIEVVEDDSKKQGIRNLKRKIVSREVLIGCVKDIKA